VWSAHEIFFQKNSIIAQSQNCIWQGAKNITEQIPQGHTTNIPSMKDIGPIGSEL
jgi:hypothetical protein